MGLTHSSSIIDPGHASPVQITLYHIKEEERIKGAERTETGSTHGRKKLCLTWLTFFHNAGKLIGKACLLGQKSVGWSQASVLKRREKKREGESSFLEGLLSLSHST